MENATELIKTETFLSEIKESHMVLKYTELGHIMRLYKTVFTQICDYK